eukprot:TRINITY_DN37773_c0_g1_i1.p1 TRINITY_DN37773_c0_g1~~TRINITY_DN37773_c0_g1_i1.p1  ORF type:complete len:333 (+),score=71.35 TRINITY_DN37773_c0_g1_i1:117-1001(+)
MGLPAPAVAERSLAAPATPRMQHTAGSCSAGGSLPSAAAAPGQNAVRIQQQGAPAAARSANAPGRIYRERVLVRVYDLGNSFVTRGMLNRMTKSYGAFHTGVEVYGREWSFGMTLEEGITGVTWNPPGQNPDHTFRETLSMGYTSFSSTQVERLIEVMMQEWRGSSYQLLTRNCHHFSDEFCKRLGVVGLPPWVNSLAGSGAATANFIDSADSGYDGGEALADFFRGVGRRISTAFGGGDPDDEDVVADEAEVSHKYQQQQAQLRQQQLEQEKLARQQAAAYQAHPDPFNALKR